MTLLANRAKTIASDNEVIRQNGHADACAVTAGKISSPAKPAAPAITPPEEALRALQTRLQAQLSNSNEETDVHSDPQVRALMHSVRRRLNQVEAALERIAEGKYGVCVDCHKPIENDRLVLQPMSVRCIGCQTVAEWRGVAY